MAEESLHLQELMRCALAGDGRAYELLLKESAAILRPFLNRYMRGNDEAHDVLQEILVSIHRARHTYDGERPFKPWLFAIAKFRLKDYLSRHYANKLRNAVDIAEMEKILEAPVTENALAHELMAESRLYLSGIQGKIIEMMHIDGYTAEETGKILGMKESAVKVAAHRAYKKLREKMGRG
jgi:RNA polymerase sigma-70 factor (ECF subfamily)